MEADWDLSVWLDADFEPFVLPISVYLSNHELSVCPRSTYESVFELSVCPISPNESNIEPPVCPAPNKRPVVCPISLVSTETLNALHVYPVNPVTAT